MLNAVFEQIGSSNPNLLQLISQNQEEFIRMINEPDGGGAPGTGGNSGGGSGGPVVAPGGPEGGITIQMSSQDKEAIDRVCFKICQKLQMSRCCLLILKQSYFPLLSS